MLHNKAHNIAMRPTPKTVIKAFLIIDGKGRRVFIVERATSLKFTSRARHLNALANNFRQGQTLTQFINIIFWDNRHEITYTLFRHQGQENSAQKPKTRPVLQQLRFNRLAGFTEIHLPGVIIF